MYLWHLREIQGKCSKSGEGIASQLEGIWKGRSKMPHPRVKSPQGLPGKVLWPQLEQVAAEPKVPSICHTAFP